VLFVVLADGAQLDDTVLDDTLLERIRGALRRDLSPRHVPDVVHVVPAVPRTLTGKKLEAPIKQVLLGRPAAEVISADAVRDFSAVSAFVAWKNSHRPGGDR
jgi:acetoacetyl-CoA synthetase